MRLTLATQLVRSRLPRSDEVAYRLMHGIGHPYPCQLACPMQTRKRHCIWSIGLDPFACPSRDKGRGDDHAIMAKLLDLTIEPVIGRSGFEARMQPAVSAR